MIAAATLARENLPTRPVCRALGLSHATLYRKLLIAPKVIPPKSALKKATHPRALSTLEREAVLAVLHSERFVDMAPAAIHAVLLDEGRYLCSPRTMYRILASRAENCERRRQTVHSKRTPPELVATAPGQVWTWDITHLRLSNKRGTIKLYVCLDLFSRYVLGWYLSSTESSAEARAFFVRLVRRERIDVGKLILHSDNGGPMRGQALCDLLESLRIERSHSRPRTSNDNAFSESQFKTMKYRPTYPKYFDSMSEARAWCQRFFQWYNHEHRHESLAMLTPADVHFGRAESKLAERAEVLLAAFEQHPNRFVRGNPSPGQLPQEVAINPHTKPPFSPEQNWESAFQEVTK